MPAFDYTAYNTAGKPVKGVINADSERQARRTIISKKLQPLTVSLVSQTDVEHRENGKVKPQHTSRISTFELSLLLQQLAILIQSGLAIEEAQRMIVEQAENEKQRRVVQSWRSEILEGRSFSEALQRCPYRIPESVIAGVSVGEESGHLHQVLLRLAEELETSAENKKAISRALIYPGTLIATSIFVVGIMMVWVVPKITVIFASSNRDMPLITRIVINLSEFTQTYGLLTLAFIIMITIMLQRLLQSPLRRQRWHHLLLSTPGLGKWLLMANIADWSRSLGTLLQNGIPALAALKISSGVVSNLYLRKQFVQVTEKMRQGNSLNKSLTECSINSGFLIHMVGSGETSSELDLMLLRVSDYYSLRLSSAVDIFLKIINPILIILMGMIILAIVAAVMLPIMDMNNMI